MLSGNANDLLIKKKKKYMIYSKGKRARVDDIHPSVTQIRVRYATKTEDVFPDTRYMELLLHMKTAK